MFRIFLHLLLFLPSFLIAQNITIHEICAKNKNIICDGDFVQFVDWIEIKNHEPSHLNITGYFLTDDTTIKTKWQFPNTTILYADSLLLVWADGKNTFENDRHASFKLSASSGLVALYDPDTILVDIIEYDEQFADISFGKSENGLAYFAIPTPGHTNTTQPYYSSERENIPALSIPSGFYPYNTTLFLEGDISTDEIRYTTDGTFPRISSDVYSDGIVMTGHTVVRARVFGNKLPSEEISASYFIDLNKSFPVVSLIISPDFLWSDSIGIFYDEEVEKRSEWERSSKIEYFIDQSMGFETENEIRLFGATAMLLPQKSFSVFMNDHLNFQIFKNKDLADFDSFILRSSSDDWNSTLFRDGFVHSMVQEKLAIDFQAYQPTVLYINGEYYGIFNLREKINEDYLKNNHGINKDNIDLLYFNYWENSVEELAGSSEKYVELINFLDSHDMTNNEEFAGIHQYLDLENYTNYITSQIYIGNRSFNHNVKAWRKNDVEDGFKWLIYDTDRSYQDSWREIFLQIYNADTVLSQILENESYRNHFLQQTCSHINATYRKSYADFMIDSLKNTLEPEMPFHIEKWGPLGGIPSMDAWNNNIQLMKDFSTERKDTLLLRLNEFFNLEGQVSVHLTKSPPKGGHVYIENILIPYHDSIHTYFKNIPVSLVARPNLGYSFLDWENISTGDSIIYAFASDETLNARFEAQCTIPDTINEDAIFLLDCSPYYINHDIVVKQGKTLYCEPGVELYLSEGTRLIVYGKISFTGNESNPITLKGQDNQTWKYIHVENGTLQFSYVECWAGEKAISFSGESDINVSHCTFYESNIDLQDLISGNTAYVSFTDNMFYGNPSNTKKDCIDCDGISGGFFSNNIFRDVSDDCIDIGTLSSDVTIMNNEFYNCQSFGISVGEGSMANIYRNILAHNFGAVQVHTDAEVMVVNNTFFDNGTGIQCFHYDNTPNTGGKAYVLNTIFSTSGEDYSLQSNSVIELSYSLSDTELHTGEGNQMADPLFKDALNDNFNLTMGSPCIDAGDEESDPDPDGTRADIGALYFDKDSAIIDVEESVSVYPNPFINNFTIRFNNNAFVKEIRGYNILGEVVLSETGNREKTQFITTSAKGLVFLFITDTDGHRYVVKIVAK